MDGTPSGSRRGAGLAVWIVVGLVALIIVLCVGLLGASLLVRGTHASAPPAAAHGANPFGVAPTAGSNPQLDGLSVRMVTASGFTGVAYDHGRGALLASLPGNWLRFDASGAMVDLHPTGFSSPCLRLANLDADPEAEVVVFEYWGRTLTACEADGTELWTRDVGYAIDEVAPADLEGDPRDELVLGLQAPGGVMLLSADGVPVWQNGSTGEAAFVCAGDTNGDGAPEILASTTRRGTLLLSADGRLLRADRRFESTYFAQTVDCPAAHRGVRWVAVGMDAHGSAIAGFGADGACRWRTNLPAGTTVEGMGPAAVATQSPWLALASNTGALHVIDLDSGRILGRMDSAAPGTVMEVAWVEEPGKEPCLAVALGGEIWQLDVSPTGSPSVAGTTESGPGLLPPRSESSPAEAVPAAPMAFESAPHTPDLVDPPGWRG